MNEQDVQQMIDNAIQAYAGKVQFEVTPVPAHTHNGVDSNLVDPNNLINSRQYYANRQTTVSSARILTLHTNPIEIIPAYGVKSVIVVLGVSLRFYPGTVGYSNLDIMQCLYTISTQAATIDFNTGILGASNPPFTIPLIVHSPGSIIMQALRANDSVALSQETNNPTGGNGYLVVSANYYVDSL